MEASFAESADLESAVGMTSEPEEGPSDVLGSDIGSTSEGGNTSVPDEEECNLSAAPAATFVAKEWFGFRLVGDKVDKNVQTTFQRIEQRMQSLHYFNVYAVQDRVDLNAYEDEPVPTAIHPPSLLPFSEDVAAVT